MVLPISLELADRSSLKSEKGACVVGNILWKPVFLFDESHGKDRLHFTATLACKFFII